MKIKQTLDTWKNVFGNWKYLTATIIIALVFYSLNVLVSSWNNLTSSYPFFGLFGTIKFFFILWVGFKSTIILHSFISLIAISFLFGMLLSLIFYKANSNNNFNKGSSLFGFFGVFLGALAPGCVACGVGLASVLGIGAGVLAFLPYEGLELSILAIGLLGFSILKISNDMDKCNIPLRKTRMKGGSTT